MEEKTLLTHEENQDAAARIQPLGLVWSVTMSETNPDQALLTEGVRPETPAAKLRLKSVWVVTAMLIVRLIYVCLVVLWASFSLVSLSGCIADQDNTQVVVDAYMRAMMRKDVDQALALFADGPGKSELRLSLEEATEGVNSVLFDGYQGANTDEITIGFQYGSEPDEPSGIVSHLIGAVSYSDGYTGGFEAVLVKVNGSWKLYSIHVDAPPQKFEDYRRNHP